MSSVDPSDVEMCAHVPHGINISLLLLVVVVLVVEEEWAAMIDSREVELQSAESSCELHESG